MPTDTLVQDNDVTQEDVEQETNTSTSSGTIVEGTNSAGVDASDEAASTSAKTDNKVKFWFREPTAEAKKKDPTLVKRADLELLLPFVDEEQLINSIGSDPKVMQYVVDIVNNAIEDEARLQVKRDENPVMSQEELDVSKLTLEYLADKPSERKSSGISKEDWQEFEAKYISVMPTLEGRDVEKVKKVAKIFVARLVPMKTSKPVLEAIQPMLATFYGSLDEGDKEKFTPIYAYLEKKFEEYMAITDEDVLAGLI